MSFVFIEFWEDQFKCRYPGSARTPYNVQYERMCSGVERLSADNIEFEAQLQFVTDAVLAFAHAIRYARRGLRAVRSPLTSRLTPYRLCVAGICTASCAAASRGCATQCGPLAAPLCCVTYDKCAS